MDINNKIDFFFTNLEDIIKSPISNQKTKIEALKVYASLLPSISKDELTVKHEVAKMDTSALTTNEKLQLLEMITKMETSNEKPRSENTEE